MEHCTAALHRFYVMQVGPHIDRDYEFLAHDARPMYKPIQQVAVTPRKYSVGMFWNFFYFFWRGFVGMQRGGGYEGGESDMAKMTPIKKRVKSR